MTLRNKLFKPKNLEEFIDRAKKEKVRTVLIKFYKSVDIERTRPIRHQNVTRFDPRFKRYNYSTHYIAVKDKYKKPNIYYIEKVGDIPFYNNSFFELYEEVGITLLSIEKSIAWADKIYNNGIRVWIPFKMEELKNLREEIIEARKVCKEKAVESYRKYDFSRSSCTSRAYARLVSTELEPKLRDLIEKSLKYV